jgi:hypothetical protein
VESISRRTGAEVGVVRARCRLLGQVGEQVPQVLAGVSDPVPLAGKVQQNLGDSQAQQFGIGQPRPSPDPARADDVVVEEHIQCDQEGVEVVVHNR